MPDLDAEILPSGEVVLLSKRVRVAAWTAATLGIAVLVVGVLVNKPMLCVFGGVFAMMCVGGLRHLRGDQSRANLADEIIGKLGPAGLLGLLWSMLPAIGGIFLLIHLSRVSNWLTDLGSVGVFVYSGLFIVLAGFGLLPTYAQALLGGWCFGVAIGFPAALAGFVGASFIGFLIARTASRNRVEQLIDEHERARAVRSALIGGSWFKTLGIITLLRVPPNSPFAVTNLVLAASGVKLVPYIIAAAVGMAPRTFAAVWIGSQLTDLKADTPRWVVFAGIGLTIIVVVIFGSIANKALGRLTSPTAEGDSTDISEPVSEA